MLAHAATAAAPPGGLVEATIAPPSARRRFRQPAQLPLTPRATRSLCHRRYATAATSADSWCRITTITPREPPPTASRSRAALPAPRGVGARVCHLRSGTQRESASARDTRQPSAQRSRALGHSLPPSLPPSLPTAGLRLGSAAPAAGLPHDRPLRSAVRGSDLFAVHYAARDAARGRGAGPRTRLVAL